MRKSENKKHNTPEIYTTNSALKCNETQHADNEKCQSVND